jgi:low temperature requirement protein LtrA
MVTRTSGVPRDYHRHMMPSVVADSSGHEHQLMLVELFIDLVLAFAVSQLSRCLHD